MIDYQVKCIWTDPMEPSISYNNTTDITPDNEYSFSPARRDTLEPLHLSNSTTDAIRYNEHSRSPARRGSLQPLHLSRKRSLQSNSELQREQRQRLTSISESQKIIEELDYSFYPLHLLKSATDIILYNDYSCCPPRRRRDRPLHPLREQPSTSRSSKSFKESESVVTSGSVMLPPITPIVKDESHGESFLPIW
eukprot:CAMPEP_0119051078 /NCGR_PEP_ID=MMETSP1177-20130426/72814_1 /TAXON_ID=2985 /ORGANISM="Ochromonas sp, Strain CCMP1899" /LENGTH=193 /DNA_ID=CAMNT_0007030161 /DNA_START=215 /DNA_END=793 /DNA_ORIENTATION=+